MSYYYFGYFPVLILQAFCLFHAYRRGQEQRWYWIILFLPLIGGVLYLYENVYHKQDVKDISQNLKEGVQGALNSNYKIKKLEKKVRYSDTIENKTELGDAYAIAEEYDKAISIYESCLVGFNADDPFIKAKLVEVNYRKEDFKSAIIWGDQINEQKEFTNSEQRISYALSLAHENELARAEKCFQEMDGPFSNYPHRIAYADFLEKQGRLNERNQLLREIEEEFDRMEGKDRRAKKHFLQEVRQRL